MGDNIRFPIFLQMTAHTVGRVAAEFSSSRQVAELCDQLIPDLGLAAQLPANGKVEQLVEALPPNLRQKLEDRFGPGVFQELISLEKENNPEIFYAELLHMAGRLAGHQSTILTAVGLYHRVETASGVAELSRLAERRRRSLEGGGTFGSKAEGVLRAVGDELGDYRNLVGALAGATLASGLYKFTICRRGMMIHRAIEAQGLGHATYEAAMMRIKARAVGMVVGSVGGALADRGLRNLLGQEVAWDMKSVFQDSAAMAINLSAWRLASSFSNSYSLRAMTAEPQPANLLWKELEIFAFRQGLTAATVGLATLANHKLFDHRPESKTAAFGQVFGLSAGMGIGGLFGVKAIRFSH